VCGSEAKHSSQYLTPHMHNVYMSHVFLQEKHEYRMWEYCILSIYDQIVFNSFLMRKECNDARSELHFILTIRYTCGSKIIGMRTWMNSS
jgi:hypothetical protein